MTTKTKICLLAPVILFLLITPVWVVGQKIKLDTDKRQLANQYFRNKDFEKASVLYKSIFDSSKSSHYFNSYLNCLFELKNYELADDELRKQVRRKKNDAGLYVQWGYLYKQQNLLAESTDRYNQALLHVQNSKGDYIRLANAFLGRREYEYSSKVYLLGRKNLDNESFHYELARVFMYQRNYELMFGEYLELLKKDDTNLGRVQSSMLSAFRMDVDHSLRDRFRGLLLKGIQMEPDVIVFNQLLIWLFIQEKRFAQALRQAIALDKRIGDGDPRIVRLAAIAGDNEGFEEAIKAYDYIIEKGESSSSFNEAHLGKMQLLYHQFLHIPKQERDSDGLKKQFEECFYVLGFKSETSLLVKDYAHFLAFYRGEIEMADQLLEKQMDIGGISRLQRDQLKNEFADIHVLKDDLWEAVLLYSQLIESNKNNPLGDEVKLKKAKLGYYMGNLSWAQAQLNVLKASTSKLIANDALELSIFISSNTALDTTAVPMQLFAKADLYAFRNQDSLAWQVLDSIELAYSYNSLLDDIYYRKAKSLIKQGDYEQAVVFLQKIMTNYAYDLLADDALFLLAEIYQQKLNREEQAGELYKQMLTLYPGSIYVIESRKRYRELNDAVTD